MADSVKTTQAQAAHPTFLQTQEATITIQLNAQTALPEFQTIDEAEIQVINSTICLQALPETSYPLQATLTLSPADGFSFDDPVGEITPLGSSASVVLETPVIVLEYGGGETATYNLTLNLIRNSLPIVWDPTIVFEPPS